MQNLSLSWRIIRAANGNNCTRRYYGQQTRHQELVEGTSQQSHSDSTNPSKLSSSSYCVQLVRKNDYENYLSTLLFPDASVRTGIFALRAFNCEIALIRDHVTQIHTGLGRYVFWKEGIRQLFRTQDDNTSSLKNGECSKNTLPRHPVIEELSRIMLTAENISQKWFQNLIESREEIMSDAPFHTLQELEKYSDKSVTPVFYLGFELMNVKNLNLDHCASHLGKAIGLTTFVRGLPYNIQRRRVLVPQELLIKHKLSQEKFVRLDEQDKIRDVVYEIATCAHLHYEKAISMRSVVEKELKSCLNLPRANPLPLFLSAVPSKAYLKRLQKFNFNPFEPALMRRFSLLPWHLYLKKFRRHYY